jgi:hypothetical protein
VNVSQDSPSGHDRYDSSKRRDSAAKVESLRNRISGTSPPVTPTCTPPSRRGSLGGAASTNKLDSLQREVVALKEEAQKVAKLTSLVRDLKSALKEKDQELATLKVGHSAPSRHRSVEL